MAFKLKNKQIKEIVGQLRTASKTHAAQADKIESAMKLKQMGKRKSPRDKMRSGSEVAKERREFAAKSKGKSPMKGKISASCKAQAKKKFKVWPSAYASGWGVRCTRGDFKKKK